LATWGKDRRLPVSSSLATDRHGNVYLVSNGDLIELSPGGRLLDRWHPWNIRGEYAFGTDDVAIDAGGIIYFVGAKGREAGLVLKVAPSPKRLPGVFKQVPNHLKLLAAWSLPQTGSTMIRCSSGPHISIDSSRYVYLTDGLHLYKYSLAGRLLATWGNRPGVAPAETLGSIVVDRQGNVYVSGCVPASRRFSGRIHKPSAQGKQLAVFQLKEYVGHIAVDARGEIFAASQHFVYKLAPTGKLLTRWG
jgi:hypothetical protein